jgi:hypothetical protein
MRKLRVDGPLLPRFKGYTILPGISLSLILSNPINQVNMKKLVIAFAFVLGGFITASAQGTPANTTTPAPTVSVTTGGTVGELKATPVETSTATPAKAGKKECSKEEKAACAEKKGHGCCAGKKASTAKIQ